MEQIARVLGAVAVTAVVAVMSGQGWSVDALSCAIHPDGTPESIVRGSEQLSSGEPFFDRYDFAITGTVTTVVTVERPGSETYGRTMVTVDVINGFGLDFITPEIELTQSDPGWMAGYPFVVGHTYFIPVTAVGPNSETNYSFVCDPITEIDGDRAAALAGEATRRPAGPPSLSTDPAPTSTTGPVTTSTIAGPVTTGPMAVATTGPTPAAGPSPTAGDARGVHGASVALGLSVFASVGLLAFCACRRRRLIAAT